MYEFSHEFKDYRNYLVILTERVQRSLNDGSQILRIEPIKEEIEILGIGHPSQNTSQYVEHLHHLNPGSISRCQLVCIH